jgi:hypothetical protein
MVVQVSYKRTLPYVRYMSALPPKADMVQHDRDVRLCATNGLMHRSKKSILFDHLVGALLELRRHVEAEDPGGIEVDH